MATVNVVVIGPESTGKTTLTRQLARHFNAPFVEEYARAYLQDKGDSTYELTDLQAIAKTQVDNVRKVLETNPPLVFCDTDLITLHIWSLDKFDKAIPFIEENLKKEKADLYLLCRPDLEWEFDPLREDALRREELHDWNAWVLKSLGATFVEISGVGDERTQTAIQAVSNFLNKEPR